MHDLDAAASPAMGTQSPDDAASLLQRSTAVRQTAPTPRVVRRGVCSLGPLSGRSAHLAHFAPRVDLSDVPFTPPSGSYSQARAWANSATRPGCQDFLELPTLMNGQRRPHWSR